jgi:hypothetical protein
VALYLPDRANIIICHHAISIKNMHKVPTYNSLIDFDLLITLQIPIWKEFQVGFIRSSLQAHAIKEGYLSSFCHTLLLCLVHITGQAH